MCVQLLVSVCAFYLCGLPSTSLEFFLSNQQLLESAGQDQDITEKQVINRPLEDPVPLPELKNQGNQLCWVLKEIQMGGDKHFLAVKVHWLETVHQHQGSAELEATFSALVGHHSSHLLAKMT